MRERRLTHLFLLLVSVLLAAPAAGKLLIPMDLTQTDHLKAYGVAYHALERGERVEWLLNYRGGSFFLEETSADEQNCVLAGVSYQMVGGADVSAIYDEIENANMEVVLLEKAPKVAIYAPPNRNEIPWDDAVNLALTYADIPFDVIWDPDVLSGKIFQYDWVHLHHEDFTGQYGKFYASYAGAPWYIEQQRVAEDAAHKLGFVKVWQLKHAVARRIREYVAQGGFLFAMCSATDALDIALAAGDMDIVDVPYDGDPPAPAVQQRLDFSQCLAFDNFTLEMNPLVYEFSDIDMTQQAVTRGQPNDFFTLFDFSAKEDPVPTMLTQDHVNVIPGFMGQTTSFNKKDVKKASILLAEVEGAGEVRYLHGNYGRGTFTFLGGHDPEDYQHRVGDPPTDLDLHKNSPGYRLILNNILFPAAEKKEQKTELWSIPGRLEGDAFLSGSGKPLDSPRPDPDHLGSIGLEVCGRDRVRTGPAGGEALTWVGTFTATDVDQTDPGRGGWTRGRGSLNARSATKGS
jgi:hypothetical protein